MKIAPARQAPARPVVEGAVVTRRQSTRSLGSTYRLQLRGVGFSGAAEAVPFLADLGIETLYVSPITQARQGSPHGYDVIDPTTIDPALGGADDLESLLRILAAHDMRLLVDIAPNHLAATVENPMFADLLRHGRRSRFASFFDVAWESADNTIVLPLLDSTLAEALDAGEVGIRRTPGGDQVLRYRNQELPIDPADNEDLLLELATHRGRFDPAARRQLELVLARQHYRLVDWREAGRLVNYRRFFDINDLIGVRQEDPSVFAATHTLVLDLAGDPRIAGFRVDHIDGLRDPTKYLMALRAGVAAAAEAWSGHPVILVEKILGRDEALPRWPVAGTTGYEFAAATTGLFVASEGAARIASGIHRAAGDERIFAERAAHTKHVVLDALFYGASGLVTRRFVRAIEPPRPSVPDISVALEALTTQVQVSRTYRRPGEPLSKADRGVVSAAASAAGPTLTPPQRDALDRITDVLRGPVHPGSAVWEAVASWQQLTAPVTAKGVEDTALYAAGAPLVGVDVGADPDHPAWSVAELHRFLEDRASIWPGALSAASTHDSKRSQDARCRLAVLTEIAEPWLAAIAALEDRLALAGETLPDPGDRWYLYETLVAAWPIEGPVEAHFRHRISDHLVKAAREAKVRTSWLAPHPHYEKALTDFATQLLADESARAIVESVVNSIAAAAVTNSLAGVVLRAAAPGVPDVYQGEDLWQLALVDPDNRAHLDLAAHREALGSSGQTATPDLLEKWQDGRIKQTVLRCALHTRRKHRELFAGGDYLPLSPSGHAADHLVAFARRAGSQIAVALVPRLVYGLAGADAFAVGTAAWGDTSIDITTLGVARLTDALTGISPSTAGGRITVADVLADLPVALLVGELNPLLADG